MNCMSSRVPPGMGTTKHRMAAAAFARRAGPAVALTLGIAFAPWQPAEAAKPHFAFAVVADTMRTAADEAVTQRLLQAIAREPLPFVVYDGNLKGANERCTDQLYADRQAALASSALPLVFILGSHDWAGCGSTRGGGYDVTERLDFLRRSIFAEQASLGLAPLPLKRESDVARFHQYRENVRWEFDGTMFVGLNVVGGNNHYLSAGGRNGEYDDRAIATAFWLQHAAELARRRQALALVVFVEADPEFDRYERAERFSWLGLGKSRPRDGYLEFKRALVKAAKTFHGPVVVIHQATDKSARGFSIDQPLFDDKGERLTNVTRIAIGPAEPTTQWVRIEVNYARQVPFLVTTRRIPANVSTPESNALHQPSGVAPKPSPNASGVVAPPTQMQMPPPTVIPPQAPSASAPAVPPLLPQWAGPSSSTQQPQLAPQPPASSVEGGS